jgi:UMF1 family MFS transporter
MNRSGVAMAKNSWLNREVFGWAMFDFANQAFTLVILTSMFGLYFIYDVVPNDESLGRQLWATAGIIALSIVVVVSPLIGALADFSGAKKRLLFITYVVSVVFTAALGIVKPGMVTTAMVIFIIGYMFYAIGENFMGAFLPELAAEGDMGKVSAFGWTLGYVGGLLCLGGAALITFKWPGPTGYRLICLWAGIFFLIAALPTFILLRERKQREPLPPGQTLFSVGFVRLATTFRSLRLYRVLFRFLVIMTFYMGGMQIIIWFAQSIGRKLFGLSIREFAVYILILSVTAIAGAFITGRIQDRIGARRTIILALVIWLLVMLPIPFLKQQNLFLFWVLGSGVGFGMGMLGTSSRAMVGLFSPPHKAAEFFGFYGLGTKIAAILGLALSIIAERMFPNSYNLVVGSSIIFFVGGLLLMFTVDEAAGRDACAKAAAEHQAQFHDYKGNLP